MIKFYRENVDSKVVISLGTVLASANQTTAPQQLSQRASVQNQLQQAVQTAVSTGAVVVQLTANRAASHGESRQTDASFEKQESAKKEDKKDVAEKKSNASAVNITA
jgi:hypothetical protein